VLWQTSTHVEVSILVRLQESWRPSLPYIFQDQRAQRFPNDSISVMKIVQPGMLPQYPERHHRTARKLVFVIGVHQVPKVSIPDR
jgi:hypothetical protein